MEPLAPENFAAAIPLLEPVEFYTGFAKSVLLGITPGVAFIDPYSTDTDQSPTPAPARLLYVVMRYGMSLLVGSPAAICATRGENHLRALLRWLTTHLRERKVPAAFEALQCWPVLEWRDILVPQLVGAEFSFSFSFNFNFICCLL